MSRYYVIIMSAGCPLGVSATRKKRVDIYKIVMTGNHYLSFQMDWELIKPKRIAP